jgi:DNA-binding XRE family transcriptional regulator
MATIGAEAAIAWSDIMEPELIELILKIREDAPPQLTEWPSHRTVQYFRSRLEFTQDEIARKAGLTQSQVSRVESGADCLLSTWTKVYAAMGFRLALLPLSDLSLKCLEAVAERGRPENHWTRQRARPRRIWRDGVMISRAEWNALMDAEPGSRPRL